MTTIALFARILSTTMRIFPRMSSSPMVLILGALSMIV